MIVSQTRVFELDDDIGEHIIKLNDKGYLTEYSCSGHIDKKTLGYIAFEVFTSNYMVKNRIKPPIGWFFEEVPYKKLGLYMDKTNDNKFIDSEDFTQEYLNERLDNLMNWIEKLPEKGLPYLFSIYSEVLNGKHNRDM